MAVSPRYEPAATIEEFFREHRAKVQMICRSLLDDFGEAEDAAQQVFLAAFRALAAGTVPRSPEAWLAAIARNECRARAQLRQPVAATNGELESPDADPSALVLTRAEIAAVWAAIGELPPSQREALLLREVRGLSYEELADDLRSTYPSIRSRLARARQAIRSRLGEGGAAIGGASWLESLARLLAGGSTPAVIATKTAAVSLGAAAITGGAIVGRELTPHPRVRTEVAAASGVAHPRRVVVLPHAHPKPTSVDAVERAPLPPARVVAAPRSVVATAVVQPIRQVPEPSIRRINRPPVSSKRPSSWASPTVVGDPKGVQPVEQQPTPSPSPSPVVAPGTVTDGQPGRDGSSGVTEAAPAPATLTPQVSATGGALSGADSMRGRDVSWHAPEGTDGGGGSSDVPVQSTPNGPSQSNESDGSGGD